MNKKWLFLILFIWLKSNGQTPIENVEEINGFYTQLQILKNKGIDKVRITHIGDSHIQADFFTGRMRTNFQNSFGNAGLGFTFPYKLAKTNGNSSVKFSSNTNFKATRNIFATTKMPVGIGGYAFQSKKENTAIKMVMKKDSLCNKITVLCNNPEDLRFTTYNSIKDFSKLIPKSSTRTHRVKSGESLWGIASKYKISVKKIQKLNRLKGNTIYPKQKLKIPTKEVVRVKVKATDFTILDNTSSKKHTEYITTNTINEMYLFSENKSKDLALFGFVLENQHPGILYNAIGINGAKCVDFNKFPLFFEQLSYLKSDLIIISLGTNESFDNLDENLFIERFLRLISNIRNEKPSVSILVTTPPASLFKRKYRNTYIEKYIIKLKENMLEHRYALWDLYEAFGGHQQINQNYKKNLLAKDRVHYTKQGYYEQADLLFESILSNN